MYKRAASMIEMDATLSYVECVQLRKGRPIHCVVFLQRGEVYDGGIAPRNKVNLFCRFALPYTGSVGEKNRKRERTDWEWEGYIITCALLLVWFERVVWIVRESLSVCVCDAHRISVADPVCSFFLRGNVCVATEKWAQTNLHRRVCDRVALRVCLCVLGY